MFKYQKVKLTLQAKLIALTNGVCALILGQENKRRLTKQKYIETDKKG